MRACACLRARARLCLCLCVGVGVCVCVCCVNSLRDADEREALEEYQRHWCERFSAERLQNIAEGGDRSDPILQQVDELEHKIEGARMLDKNFDTNYPTWEADVHELEESYVRDDDEKVEELLAKITESTMAAVSRSASKKQTAGFFKTKVAPEEAAPSDVKRSRAFRPLESVESLRLGTPEPLADAAIIEETCKDVEGIPQEWMDGQPEPLEMPAQVDPGPIGKRPPSPIGKRPPSPIDMWPSSASNITPIPDRKRPTTLLEQIESRKHTIQGMGCVRVIVHDHHRVLVLESGIELEEELT